MTKIRKGDIVGRISYGKDILFEVEKILNVKNCTYAILKGITIRIMADAPLSDLEIIKKKQIQTNLRSFENELEARIHRNISKVNPKKNFFKRDSFANSLSQTGTILHLDGDKKYSQKSARYYKEMGLNAIVKNIPESRQPDVVLSLLTKYKPDILIITGHDGMIKNGTHYHDIYNYRNSRHFVNTVKEARKWIEKGNDLVIFAGACQSFFEAIIESGANFASSPARILIDFMDPLVVAEKVAVTEDTKYISIRDIEPDLRDGIRAVSGIGAKGKKKLKLQSNL